MRALFKKKLLKPLSWRYITGLILFSGSLLASVNQYVPFLDPYTPSRDYLQYQSPSIPWKIPSAEPSLAEVLLYRERLSIQALEEEAESKLTPNLETMPHDIFNPIITVPTLGGLSRSIAPEVTVSPWINVTTPQTNPSDSEAKFIIPQNSSTGPWIQQSITNGNSNILIPFSFTPGQQPPPASSAVIYSQPDPMGR